jgi:hypothetical protein
MPETPLLVLCSLLARPRCAARFRLHPELKMIRPPPLEHRAREAARSAAAGVFFDLRSDSVADLREHREFLACFRIANGVCLLTKHHCLIEPKVCIKHTCLRHKGCGSTIVPGIYSSAAVVETKNAISGMNAVLFTAMSLDRGRTSRESHDVVDQQEGVSPT